MSEYHPECDDDADFGYDDIEWESVCETCGGECCDQFTGQPCVDCGGTGFM